MSRPFAIGDRVRLIGGPYVGTTGVLMIHEPERVRQGVELDHPITRMTAEGAMADTAITAQIDWLEHISEVDEPAPETAGSPEATVSAGVEGTEAGDPGSAGTAAEPQETEQPWISPLEPTELGRLESKLEHAEDRIAQLEKLLRIQGDINQMAGDAVLDLAQLVAASHAEHRTTRRMRVNITRNTKGYNFDTTFEASTDDPNLDLSVVMTNGLREADRRARHAITEAEYCDREGVPGEDDTADETPF